jgi:nicotinamide N-methyltransferase
MDNDPMDTFGSGMSILFNEPEINVGDFGESLVLNFPNQKPIELTIPDCDVSNTKLFAHHIWKASILLSKMLLELNVEDKTLLELGAAAGIPSILACRKGAIVTASDYPDSDLLLKLKNNLARNCTREAIVKGHCWGDSSDGFIESSGQFDVILMADTLWMRDQHANLLSDLKLLLKPNGIILGVCGLHSGKACVDAFFKDAIETLKLDYFIPTRIPIGHGFGIDDEWEEIGIEQVIDKIPDRNRFLFKFQLSWSV